MASLSMSELPSPTDTAFYEESTPAQGALLSAGAGITGGYNGDSLALQIIISVLLGLALYNAVELILLVLVTFQRYHGLYFWSLLIAGFGVLPYSLGFLIKFFQLLNPNGNVGYIAVALITIGWWSMVTGQSVVLWSRLHLLTNSRKTLRWTLYMIIVNGFLLHSITTILTFASNANNFSPTELQRFVNGYSVFEKIQMVGFFLQELILSVIYIRETIRLLRLGQSVQDDVVGSSLEDGTGQLRNAAVRKTMYQILAINIIIITMDVALLATEFANLYLIETTLKGVVYSIKLKLEFAVLSKLVQIVRVRNGSHDNNNNNNNNSSRVNGTGSGSGGGCCVPDHDHRHGGTSLSLEKTKSGSSTSRGTTSHGSSVGGLPPRANTANTANTTGSLNIHGALTLGYPDFVDPRMFNGEYAHATRATTTEGLWRNGGVVGWEHETEEERERWRRRSRVTRPKGSWIDEEMDKHNIG